MNHVLRVPLNVLAISAALFGSSVTPVLASGCGGWCWPTPPTTTATGSVSASVKQNQMAWTSNMVDMRQSATIDITGPDNLRSWVSGEQQLWGSGSGDFSQNQQLDASLQFSRPAPPLHVWWNPWWGWGPTISTAVNVFVDVSTAFGR